MALLEMSSESKTWLLALGKKLGKLLLWLWKANKVLRVKEVILPMVEVPVKNPIIMLRGGDHLRWFFNEAPKLTSHRVVALLLLLFRNNSELVSQTRSLKCLNWFFRTNRKRRLYAVQSVKQQKKSSQTTTIVSLLFYNGLTASRRKAPWAKQADHQS